MRLLKEPGVEGSRSELRYPAPESKACTAPGGLGRWTLSWQGVPKTGRRNLLSARPLNGFEAKKSV